MYGSKFMIIVSSNLTIPTLTIIITCNSCGDDVVSVDLKQKSVGRKGGLHTGGGRRKVLYTIIITSIPCGDDVVSVDLKQKGVGRKGRLHTGGGRKKISYLIIGLSSLQIHAGTTL